jgi:hypothetical protein
MYRTKPRCRTTDFYGLTSAPRSFTPGAGEYTPELVPDAMLRQASNLSTCDSGISSHWARTSQGGFSFSFSRPQSHRTGVKSPTTKSMREGQSSTVSYHASGERAVKRRGSETSDVTLPSSWLGTEEKKSAQPSPILSQTKPLIEKELTISTAPQVAPQLLPSPLKRNESKSAMNWGKLRSAVA